MLNDIKKKKKKRSNRILLPSMAKNTSFARKSPVEGDGHPDVEPHRPLRAGSGGQGQQGVGSAGF